MSLNQSENGQTEDYSDRSPGGGRDVREQPIDEETESQREKSILFTTIVRLAFPIATLLFSIMYVENTFGRIRTENLYYPYFVATLLVFVSVTVCASELRDLYRSKSEETFFESVKASVREWQRSVGLVFVGGVYLLLVDVIGFFIATFVSMISIMLLGGRRDIKMITISTLVIVVLIYVLFVQLMGLQPPEGPLGI